ncbi:uncharacterized protein LOC143594770 [Bidens hawaiensis]|uniref:uncharacterized protein LOC143594770 n=1 Tax=Bidens hawaiensis TaxID=980011 RepID=UPI00404B773E
MTVIKPKATAKQAWDAIAHLFQDNQASRAITLKNRLINTKLESFPNISAYCQELKVIADQLANVDAPISDADLVLQMVTGLTNTEYDAIGMFISQTIPLPTFFQARSRLTQEETRRTGQASNSVGGTALHTTISTPHSHPSRESYNRGSPGSANDNRGSYDASQRGGRGRGSRGRGRGRSRGRGNHNQPSPIAQVNQGTYPPSYNTQWGYNSPLLHTPYNTWHTPPTPHPTVPANRPTTNLGPHLQPGILGPPPPPPQAHYTQYTNANQYVPTNIEQAMHTMMLNPDLQWNLDTGATNHKTNTTGTLSSYFNNRISNNIVVGNGFQIPILGTGYTKFNTAYKPLHANNILYAPNLIKNLLSVRRLIIDNMISIEFDPFGFLVKDYLTRIPILRSNSTDDLYPLTLTTDTKFTSPSTFAALSQDLWHKRLGHPGHDLLQFLNKQHTISVEQPYVKRICQLCVFGKHVKLPFLDSIFITHLPFDIVHSDL